MSEPKNQPPTGAWHASDDAPAPAAPAPDMISSAPTIPPVAQVLPCSQEPPPECVDPVPKVPEQIPNRIGRYRVLKILGQGGFGVVYLAHDDDLKRRVAIKVPLAHRISSPQDAEAYLVEAQILAQLDHPHIVPVHDFGRAENGLPFVVSKFIEGSNLADQIKQARRSFRESAALVARMAEALQFAHQHGLVHRDVKPGNILIDANNKAFLVDFGLALKEEDFGKGGGVAGTPGYMSPEQANGEGHRVDGRSDIFSLGVVLYELLAGKRPFVADTVLDMVIQIVSVEVRPPRQMDPAIPKELERITLKALSKRASERYATALDFADDLTHWLEADVGGQKSEVIDQNSGIREPQTAAKQALSSEAIPLKIVPKGLRSFDAHDADFYLELLPGPRDREGLPDTLRFWKTRIEETDGDKTFPVGVIYGPSGCGKSSFLKAGLLPRLASHVRVVYVEAALSDTETRLLQGMRKQCPDMPSDSSLREAIAHLRRDQRLRHKVLLVVDQFEQWLHGKHDHENAELVQALRQCDGERVQCIVMVRDDFWMALTRLMRDIEIRLIEGQNSAAVDLFDMRHARKVLTSFGIAYGDLPEDAEQTKDQVAFLEQAVAGLAQEGKVVSVRLALFADMVKSKPWTPATLKEVGGMEGIGATFLEETFSAATAPLEHRYHQKAARAVLQALLPESGTDIKGQMRSRAELLEASGYAGRPKDFENLLSILNSEVRLITPTDSDAGEPSGVSRRVPNEPDSGEPSGVSRRVSDEPNQYYQLTHDYLVPSLRDWLTRKQKESRRGRAELLLADRALVWNARPENRQLPSLMQWWQIRWWTAKRNWTPPQQKMMAKATRYHALRAAVVALILALIGLGSWEGFGRLEARRLRDRLLEATTADVPGIVKDMTPYRRWVDPLLRTEQDLDARKQLHTSIALLPVDPKQVGYLYERLLKGDPQEVMVIREALLGHRAVTTLTGMLWPYLENAGTEQDKRLRAACALAVFAPDDARWNKASRDVAVTLINQEPFVLAQWTEALKGVEKWLIPRLADDLVDENISMSKKGLIAKVYGSLTADIPGAGALLENQLAEQSDANAPIDVKVAVAKKQASIGVALAVMGKSEHTWPLLKHGPDPTLRSYLMERLAPAGVDAKMLIARLDEEQDTSAKRALLLSLGEYSLDRLPLAERRKFVPRLLQLYRDDVDPGIHAAAEWLLRQWQASEEMKTIDKELATGKIVGQRRWYINRQGQLMVVVAKPGEFWMGEKKERHRRRIERSFAIASKEVTVEHFLRFMINEYDKDYAPTGDCPINRVSWYIAAAYCNFLSQQDGIKKEQWCYVIDKKGITMAVDYLKREGYRLPTEEEWDFACRAGSDTAYSFGEPIDLLEKYGWYRSNSGRTSQPVGMLKPNDLGLFDMHGNVWEWCQDAHEAYGKSGDGKALEGIDMMTPLNTNLHRVMRGGWHYNGASELRSANRGGFSPWIQDFFCGFRPVRTVAPGGFTALLPGPAGGENKK